SNEENEPRDMAHGPWSWLGNLLRVHVIGWNRHLREVIEEVVSQDLNRLHRQERQPDARAKHAEQIAEARNGPPSDVFEDGREGLAALEDSLLQHHQALFQ